jgi:3-oxoadipate enol-lactonase
MLLPLSGRTIYYDLVGPEQGAVVCLCHALAADSGMWAEQVPSLLAEGYRVLRIDMRGHGGSDAPPGNYMQEDLAADVIAVLDALGIEAMHYVGLSIGGMFGQTLGINHGKRVHSLMLCNTSPVPPADAAQRWGPRIEAVKRHGSLEPIADATMQRWLTDRYREAHPSRWKQIYDTVLGCTPQGYMGCVHAIRNYDYTKQLSSIKTPTMMLFGADDANVESGAARQMAALLPNGRYEEIGDGARHLPNVEFPDAFNRLMLDWLKSRRA